jgi:phosphoglycolate phosphatase
LEGRFRRLQLLKRANHAWRCCCGAVSKATSTDHKALVDKVDCFIFDCDGVIWKGDKLIDGVPETLAMLREMVRRGLPTTSPPTRRPDAVRTCTLLL